MRTDYKTIQIEISGPVATLSLNRPEIHNAFNETMISEILHCVTDINNDDNLRILILRGNGRSFCAGADLNWMKDVASYTYDKNFKESMQLSECFYSIYTCKKTSIAVVHGAAIGGANGLLAACDFAFCEENTTFSLSEVKIGIVPACISPYVLKRVGESNARELMLTGKRFTGAEAEKTGLVNRSLTASAMYQHIDSLKEMLLTSGPAAMQQCKQLIHEVTNNLSLAEAKEFTAKMIADIRASREGQEGMAAFLEKRKPNWIINH